MQENLSSLIWGITTIMAAFLVLTFCIVALVLYHNRKVREFEDQFRLLFNRAFDTLLLFDPEGRVVNSNETASLLLGYGKEELLRLRLEDLVSKMEFPEIRARLQDVLASGMDAVREVTLKNNIGHEIETEVGCKAIKTGNQDFVLASFRDLTSRKVIERELERKNSALKEVLANIEEEKLQVKKSFGERIETVLLPMARRLANEDGTLNQGYFKTLEDTLTEMSFSFGGLDKAFERLSPREIEVCRLIKSGATNKEIARSLNLSYGTVAKHRERIRKKLVISKKGINLSAILQEGDA
jgi:PAS domain S-box-containing protein